MNLTKEQLLEFKKTLPEYPWDGFVVRGQAFKFNDLLSMALELVELKERPEFYGVGIDFSEGSFVKKDLEKLHESSTTPGCSHVNLFDHNPYKNMPGYPIMSDEKPKELISDIIVLRGEVEFLKDQVKKLKEKQKIEED